MNSTIILSILLLTLSFIGIAVKILIKKDGQFAGTCASNNPLLNKNGEKCSYCGAEAGDLCKKEENLSEK